MGNGNRQGRDERDNSLLASVAGVPLTRSTRIAVRVVWAGFWAARFLYTDAMLYIAAGDWPLAALELIGENPFDQGFSICMAYLTVEVVAITLDELVKGGTMLFAKTPASFRKGVADTLSIAELEALVAKKRRKAELKKEAKAGRKQC